jgi:omega-6 fatty acid desaturase (delta-12 desaturase)
MTHDRSNGPSRQDLRNLLARYQRPDHGRSLFELLTTVIPLAALWGAALFCTSKGWWWGLVLALPAAAFLVRLFMIQHDCGHHAFFRGAAANTWIGRIIGVLTMTPYDYWRRTHAIHHATSSNLDRRGLGAIEMLTVAEYRALAPLKRLAYRLYRHPVVMLGLGPAYMFVLQHRLPIGVMKEGWAWKSVMGNNLGLLVFAVPLMLLGGPTAFLAVHLTVVIFAASIGVWLFYVQHQFEGAYWRRNDSWTSDAAAFHGSSQLVLPQPLRWLTANIGDHHLHHAASRIPFYRLPQVAREHPQLEPGARLGLLDSFRAFRLALWDEAAGRLVSFRQARRWSGDLCGSRTRQGSID